MKKLLMTLALVVLFLSACGPQARVAVTDLPQTATLLPTATNPPPTATFAPPTATLTPLPSLTPTLSVTLFPLVKFSDAAICREGPDPQYYVVTRFTAGQSSQAQGRSEDGSWLLVLSQAPNKSSVCWVPVSSLEDFGAVSELLVSYAPALPVGPSRAVTSKGVCGVNRQGAIVVEWSPVGGGTGYFVYRNGKNIATVYGGSYIDRDTPGSPTPYVYTYVIQAFNSVGLSKVTASASVTLCD